MGERRDNVRSIAPDVHVGRPSERVELWEFSASTEGGVLIAAGQWLSERHGTPNERTVESINWSLGPDDGSSRFILRLTLSRFPDRPDR